MQKEPCRAWLLEPNSVCCTLQYVSLGEASNREARAARAHGRLKLFCVWQLPQCHLRPQQSHRHGFGQRQVQMHLSTTLCVIRNPSPQLFLPVVSNRITRCFESMQWSPNVSCCSRTGVDVVELNVPVIRVFSCLHHTFEAIHTLQLALWGSNSSGMLNRRRSHSRQCAVSRNGSPLPRPSYPNQPGIQGRSS